MYGSLERGSRPTSQIRVKRVDSAVRVKTPQLYALLESQSSSRYY